MRGTDALRRSDAVARSYRAALARLVRGEGRHADHAGRVVRISPASVAREAGRSRNPLYTTHRDILDEIEAGVPEDTRAQVGRQVDRRAAIGQAQTFECGWDAEVKVADQFGGIATEVKGIGPVCIQLEHELLEPGLIVQGESIDEIRYYQDENIL